jgi:hypothetical protein
VKLKLTILLGLLVGILLIQPFKTVQAAKPWSQGCEAIHVVGGPIDLKVDPDEMFDLTTTIKRIQNLTFKKGELIQFRWKVMKLDEVGFASQGALVGNPNAGPKDADKFGQGSLDEEIDADGKRTFDIQVIITQAVRKNAWIIRYWLDCKPVNRRAELPTATDEATVVVSLTPPPTTEPTVIPTTQPTTEPTAVVTATAESAPSTPPPPIQPPIVQPTTESSVVPENQP